MAGSWPGHLPSSLAQLSIFVMRGLDPRI